MTEQRFLGNSGLSTPPLMLGGNVFGWTIDKGASFAVLDRFVDAGGTLIDTADVYSSWVPGNQGGESETIIGEWLKASGKRGKVQIATKVGWRGETGDLSPAAIAEGAEASLRRLGIDTIDLYFAHRDDPRTPQAETLGAFDTLIEAGKVRAIGASNFHAARLKSALDIATREGLPHYRVMQPEYNLLRRHGFEGELQDLCVTHNIGVVPYFSLASGFLSGKYRSAADAGKSARGGRIVELLEGNETRGRAILEAMDEVAAETGASLVQIALAWLAAQPGVTAPIASATSAEQLDELVGSWELQLTRDQLDRLTAAGA